MNSLYYVADGYDSGTNRFSFLPGDSNGIYSKALGTVSTVSSPRKGNIIEDALMVKYSFAPLFLVSVQHKIVATNLNTPVDLL